MPVFRVRADQSERGVLLHAPSAAAAIVRACLEHPDEVGVVVLRAAEGSRALPQASPEQVHAVVRDVISAYGYAAVDAAVREIQAQYEAAAAAAAAAEADTDWPTPTDDEVNERLAEEGPEPDPVPEDEP